MGAPYPVVENVRVFNEQRVFRCDVVALERAAPAVRHRERAERVLRPLIQVRKIKPDVALLESERMRPAHYEKWLDTTT